MGSVYIRWYGVWILIVLKELMVLLAFIVALYV